MVAHKKAAFFDAIDSVSSATKLKVFNQTKFSNYAFTALSLTKANKKRNGG